MRLPYLYSDEYIPDNRLELLDWLNESSEDEQDYLEQVRLALRNHEFSFCQNRQTGKRSDFSNKLLPKKMPGA
jgi:hypothetical protein